MEGVNGPILLTGATGQVGGKLLGTLASLGRIVAPSREETDMSRPESLRTLVRAIQPRWIVNPAAYTAVDKAESERDLAFAVNAESVAILGEEAARIGALVLHFSTDYVFAGTGTAPYRETDATAPVSVYGASKLAGEEALAASGAAHMIFRTSWVYGATGKNFLLTILRLARERDSLRIVADQHGAPTSSRDLARMTAAVMRAIEDTAARKHIPIVDAAHGMTGVYHACGAGETTWFGFAEEALRQIRSHDPRQRIASLQPITSEEYPTPAKRPANSRLNCEKLANTFNWNMPPWDESLIEVLQEITETPS